MSMPFTRRDFLAENAMGIGGIALAWLLQQDRLLANPSKLPKDAGHHDLKPKKPHFAAKATAMISLFQHGGPSHIDLMDPKPALTKANGTDYQGDIHYSFVNRASKKLLGSPWKFQPRGDSRPVISQL